MFPVPGKTGAGRLTGTPACGRRHVGGGRTAAAHRALEQLADLRRVALQDVPLGTAELERHALPCETRRESCLNRLRPSASVSSSQSASNDCGMTRIPARVGMKFVSPCQRGTICQCTWPGSPAPATCPRFNPTLNPSARIVRSKQPDHLGDRLHQVELLGRFEVGPGGPRGAWGRPTGDHCYRDSDSAPSANTGHAARPAGRGQSSPVAAWQRKQSGSPPASRAAAARHFFPRLPEMYASRQGAQSCS